MLTILSTVKYVMRPKLFAGALLVQIALPGVAHGEMPPLIDLAAGGADVTVTGASNGDHSGFSLAAGDVNGDGRADLIVLSYWAKPFGGARIGELDIVWGATFPASGNVPLSQDSPIFARVFGATSQAWNSEISGGDFNGDGYFDIIWGQPYGPDPGFGTPDGVAYVVLGSGAFPDTLDIAAGSQQVITLLGIPYIGAGFGAATHACDLNGDGYDEIIVAAPWHTWAEVFVVWGSQSMASLYDMALSPAGVTRIVDTVPNQQTGWNLASADFDDDGYEDLVVSSSGSMGIVTVLFGQPTFPSQIAWPDETFRMKRIFGNGAIGSSIVAADFNGDGNCDLALADGVADPFGCRDCGEAYVITTVSLLPDSVSLDDAEPGRVFGSGNNTFYGSSLLAGDLTGDGRDELIVVGKGNYNVATSVDQTVVIYGSATPLDSVLVSSDSSITRIRGPYHGVDLGRGLAVGDFNGDAIDDLALGAHAFQQNAGRTYVFFGSHTVSDTNGRAPVQLVLQQNYPNPFNPGTTITYSVANAAHVRLVIYDISGERVATLVDEQQGPGDRVVRWNGMNYRGARVASGVYLYRLYVDGQSRTKKMVLLR